jgi:quercetin dioxygenase-like cupin family protein
MGYYYQWEDFPLREISYLKGRPEASKLLVRIMASARMMVTQINAKKGALVPLHHHEAEQIILVLKGQIRGTTGKEAPQMIGPGGIWVVPSNMPHRVEYVEDTEAIEVVSPPRMDNFVGYTLSHTFFDE